MAQNLVELLVPDLPGLTIANATYIGHASARGTFSNGNSCGLPLDSGVILASGPVENAVGPNDDSGFWPPFDSNLYPTPGDADLDALIGAAETLDASVLEFDVSSPTPFLLRVKYLYASEEYPEFIGSFNDPMAIFVNGAMVNAALVPGTSDLVAVHTINGGCVSDFYANATPSTNPEYYVDNHDPSYSALPPYQANDDMFTAQYDGMTILLRAEIPIPANQTTHIKIAIADYGGTYGDRSHDSAVFVGSWSPNECQ